MRNQVTALITIYSYFGILESNWPPLIDLQNQSIYLALFWSSTHLVLYFPFCINDFFIILALSFIRCYWFTTISFVFYIKLSASTYLTSKRSSQSILLLHVTFYLFTDRIISDFSYYSPYNLQKIYSSYYYWYWFWSKHVRRYESL